MAQRAIKARANTLIHLYSVHVDIHVIKKCRLASCNPLYLKTDPFLKVHYLAGITVVKLQPVSTLIKRQTVFHQAYWSITKNYNSNKAINVYKKSTAIVEKLIVTHVGQHATVLTLNLFSLLIST